MSFEFGLPNFQPQTPWEQKLYSYLYQTVQQLNWAMKHIGTAQNSIIPVYQQEGGTYEITTPESFSQLKDLIIKSADVVEAISMSVTQQLRGRYLAKSEFGTYAEETQLKLDASDKRITQNYENIQTVTSHMESLSGQMSRTNAYIRTGLIAEDAYGLPVYGLEIGQTNELNGTTIFHKFARFSSSRLSFFDQNDTEIAYISDYKLYITNAHITGSLNLGEYEIDTTDGLAFRWIGGN